MQITTSKKRFKNEIKHPTSIKENVSAARSDVN